MVLLCDSVSLECINMHVTTKLSVYLFLGELASAHWFLATGGELQLCLPRGRRDQRHPVWLWFSVLPPSLLLSPPVRLLFHLFPRFPFSAIFFSSFFDRLSEPIVRVRIDLLHLLVHVSSARASWNTQTHTMTEDMYKIELTIEILSF